MNKSNWTTYRIACILWAPMLIVCAGTLHAQGMSFSVYMDTTPGESSLYMVTSVADNSWGCSHGGYMTTARLTSPSGRTVASQSSGLQASTSLDYNDEYGDYSVATDGSYQCSCIFGGTAGFGGSQTTFVQRPTSLNMYKTDALTGTPTGCSVPARYWNFRDYQVMDQQTPPQAILKVMSMKETFTTPTNTCQVSFVAGDQPTGSSGQFRDQFFMCGPVPVCDGGGSCQTVRSQTWKADGNQVGQYTITYTCSGVTINP
jgi:hypothetical protein